MDKNTVTGLILIALVLVGFGYWNTTRQEQYRAALAADSAQVQAPENADARKAEPGQPRTLADEITQARQAAAADTADIFHAAIAGQGDTLQAAPAAPVILENTKVSVELNPQGGTVKAVRLKDFRSYADFHAGNSEAQLVLFDDSTSQMNLQFETVSGIYNSAAYRFQLAERTDTSVTLSLAASSGDKLLVTYTLIPETYIVNMNVRMDGHAFRAKNLGIQWQDRVRQQEKGLYFENMYSTLTYREDDGDTEKLNEQKADEKTPEKKVQWVAFKNQYFSAVLISPELMQASSLRSVPCEEGSGFVKEYAADLSVPLRGQDATLQLYLGPNQYRYLQSMEQYRIGQRELRLEKLVYLGWPVVRWINRFFTIYVFDFLTGFGMNMGIVLLIITLLLRVIVYPTTRKSYLSSAKMRVLKPKVDALNEKYPKQEDAMKKQQEMMQLYSQYGVSPMGGCLPALIQAPIWIALFNFVPNAIELRGQSFLWADDLSAYDDVISWGKDIWLIGDHLSIFCVLFCIMQIATTWISMKQQQSAAMSPEQEQSMKMMRWMMYLMPLMFFFVLNNYSSGLNYYYFLSGLTTVLIMWFLRKTTDDDKLLAQLEAYKARNANNPKKQSGMAARLEALQKMAEEAQRQQKK